MRILEYVPGVLLVVSVPSRSGGEDHVVSIVYEGEKVMEVGCTCKGFKWRKQCWAIEAALQLSGEQRMAKHHGISIPQIQ